MNENQLGAIADVLMAAAHADQHLDQRERDSVKGLLEKILGATAMPESVAKRIELFDVGDFDLKESVAELGETTKDQRRKLLELVAAVHEADDVIDLDEHEFLVKLAQALGAAEEEYTDLTLEVLSVEDLRDSLHDIAGS